MTDFLRNTQITEISTETNWNFKKTFDAFHRAAQNYGWSGTILDSQCILNILQYKKQILQMALLVIDCCIKSARLFIYLLKVYL